MVGAYKQTLSHTAPAFFIAIFFLSACAFPLQANASVSFEAGSFAKKASTGAQPVTGVGFQPKAVIFYWSRNTADNATITAGGGSAGIGFASDASDERAVTQWSDDNTTSNTGRGSSATQSIVITGAAGATLGAADLTSFDPDGFTLNWGTADANAYVIRYMAFGGNDLTNASVGTFVMSTSGASQNQTGLGFKPDFIFFLPSPGTTNGTFTTAQGEIQLGFTAGPSQGGSVALGDVDAVGTAQTCSFLDDNGSVILGLIATIVCGAAADIDTQATLASFDPDGFTFNISNLPTASTNVFYLAFKGGAWNVGSLDKPTSAQSQSVNVGFQPSGLFFTSAGKADATLASQDSSATADFHWSIGAASSPASRGNVLVISDDADTSLNPGARTVSTAAIQTGTDANGSTFTLTGAADLTVFNPNGFTLNWTTADGTPRRVLYWAFGDPPPNRRFRLFEGFVLKLISGTIKLFGV